MPIYRSLAPRVAPRSMSNDPPRMSTEDRIWRYRTNESVRGAPLIDDTSGLAYLGGHDGVLYAIVIRASED